MKLLSEFQADWPALSRHLDDALSMPAAERPQWLAGLVADEHMKRTLARLLDVPGAVETGDFMHTLPKLGALAPSCVDTAAPKAGDQVGPWRLLRELGEGGMGSVWLAERADGAYQRQVALKLPRLGWARGLAERLARERDILATLEHPHIARLYDAGLDAARRPWLALEFVRGQAIDSFARESELDTRQRVLLLLQVCDAVAYAHSRLVVHRDLKPSNILVTDDGRVKLLDFGIAKLAEGGGTAAPLTELTGTALTAGYASPEQLVDGALTTATDVFSLGVVAYQLLSGRLPFERGGGSLLAYERALQAGPPPLASTLCVQLQAATALAGDLDAVLDRALQFDPSQRYAGVDDLGADLRAWLAGDAVSARRRRPVEQLRHWARRHRQAAAAGVLVVCTLLVATAVSAWQAWRAHEQADMAASEAARARKEAAHASANQALLARIFQLNSVDQPDPLRAQRTTVRELLDLAARSVDEVLRETPQAQLSMLETLATLYGELGAMPEATQAARRRVDIARSALAADDPRRAEALLSLAGRLHDTPERPLARSLIDEAHAVMRRAGPAAEHLAGALALQRARHERWGRLAVAVQHAEEAVRWFREREPSSGLRSTALYFASTVNDLAGNPGRGLELLDEARQLANLQGASGGRALLTAVADRGDLLSHRGLWAEAEAAHDEAVRVALRLLGPDNTSSYVTGIQRARFLVDSGRVEEGLQAWTAIERRILERQPPLPSWWVDYARTLMHRLDMERGRADLLEPRARASVARVQESVPDSMVAATRRLLLARGLLAMGRVDEAAQELARAQAVWQRATAGLDTPGLDTPLLETQAALLLARGQAEEALALLQSAPPRSAVLPGAPDRGMVRLALLQSAAWLKLGQPEQALSATQLAQGQMRKLPAPMRWPAQEADTALAQGRALLALGRRQQALAALRRAVDERRAFDLPGSLWLAQAERALAQAQAPAQAQAKAKAPAQAQAQASALVPAPAPVR